MRARLIAACAVLGMMTSVVMADGVAQVVSQIAPPPPPPPGARGSAAPQTRQVPIGTAVISGTVVAADTGRPLRNASVSLGGNSDVQMPGRGGRTGPAASGGAPGSGGQRGSGGGGVGVAVTAGIAGLFLNRSTITDAEGRFTFDYLPSGRFTVSVSRQAYLPVNYGQRAYGRAGTSIAIQPGQKLSLSIRMTRTSSLSGTVIGEDGEPRQNAQIQVFRYAYVAGFRRLQQSNGASSDDRGQYRVAGLQPGDYVVAATLANDVTQADRAAVERRALEDAIAEATSRAGQSTPPSVVTVRLPGGNPGPSPGYAPTYYPGTPSAASAATITIEAGADRTDVDIPVLSIRAGAIRGTVVTPPGLTVPVQLMLVNTDPAFAGGSNGARANPDGSFAFWSVAPGTYRLRAQTMPQPVVVPQTTSGVAPAPMPAPQLQDSERLSAETMVTVDGLSTPSVTLSLEPGRSISGVVVFETNTPIDLSRTRMTVTASPAPSAEPMMLGGPAPQGLVTPDGRFTIQGVAPGRYVLRAPGQMKSAVVNGIDALDFPLEVTGERDITNATITISDRLSELAGRLTESNGQPAFDYTILLVADDGRYWTPGSRRILISRPGNDGSYTFRGFPPGGYLLAAVTDLEPGSQFDPGFLKELASAAMRVSVSEGGRVTQNIQVAR